MESDEHFWVVARYVERNALRANLVLVLRAEEWRWSSLWQRCHPTGEERSLLAAWPIDMPANWLERVNQTDDAQELEALPRSVQRGRPFGQPEWQKEIAQTFGPRVGLSSHGSPAKGGPKSKCLARVKIARTSAGPLSLTISDLSRFPLPSLTISDLSRFSLPAFGPVPLSAPSRFPLPNIKTNGWPHFVKINGWPHFVPFGSRSLGPVGRRPSQRHDGQTYQWRSRSSSTHQDLWVAPFGPLAAWEEFINPRSVRKESVDYPYGLALSFLSSVLA